MPYCPKCGAEVNESAAFCPACGNQIGQTANNSGGPGGADQHYSPSGQPIINIYNTNANANVNTNVNKNGYGGATCSPYNKNMALILCILGFLGLAGLHRFYVRKNGSGIIYIFTIGLFGIGTIIDLFLILSGGFRDSNGFPLRH